MVFNREKLGENVLKNYLINFSLSFLLFGKKGNPLSFIVKAPGGQWLLYCGHEVVGLLCTEQDVVGSNPETGKKIRTQISL